jgi:hypothetical protein
MSALPPPEVNQIFMSCCGLLQPPYLFVEPVLFQMLNQT